MLFLLVISISPILLLIVDKGGELTKRQQLPELKGVQFYTLCHFDLDKDGNPAFFSMPIMM